MYLHLNRLLCQTHCHTAAQHTPEPRTPIRWSVLRATCSHNSVRPLPRSQQPWRLGPQLGRGLVLCAASTEVRQATETKEEFYEVTLPKPLGIKFARGNDGGAYVVRSDPRLGNTDERVEAGDKIVNISASFGDDVWEAKNFGQVMYAVKTRNGDVYLKFKRYFGDMSALEEEEMTEAERLFKLERGGGNYGIGTKELQEKNYISRKEAERKRRELFEDALAKFKAGQIEEALIDFENVISLEPKNYVGDNFSRVTDIFRVTQYNIACCYSSLKQVDAGLEALNATLAAGFDDFQKVRSDPNLKELRKTEKFTQLVNKYDEPLLNENAIKALKSIFNFGKGGD